MDPKRPAWGFWEGHPCPHTELAVRPGSAVSFVRGLGEGRGWLAVFPRPLVGLKGNVGVAREGPLLGPAWPPVREGPRSVHSNT